MVNLTVNGRSQTLDVAPDVPLLWAIRDELGLTGTKFGCGAAHCGACTVHVEGQPVRSCVMPVGKVAGKKITTIEGLSRDGRSHPLQKAWVAEQVPQCGYCQSGQIMQAAALLAANRNPSREQIVQHMNGNICRCGTYVRIVRAIERAAKEG
jgi:isoquinoline 1-oxidoreductase alpha subunit